MQIEVSKLRNVLVFYPDVFKDHRGSYIETFNQKAYTKAIRKHTGFTVSFKQDDLSISKAGVLRGIHGDAKTWKLISCPYGSIYLVVLDPESGKWESFNIGPLTYKQVLIPPGYGNGHYVHIDGSIFSYKQSTYYGDVKQFTIRWNDPKYNIRWPTLKPILSKRDNGFRTKV